MADEKRIDDESLEDVAGGNVGLQQNLHVNPGDGPGLNQDSGDDAGSGGGGGGGADLPEGEGGNTGNQDLQI